MAKLEKRTYRFPKELRTVMHKMNGFTLPQRERTVLDADKKPEFGVSQPMPPR